MINLLRKLELHETAKDISMSGIDLGTTRTRILCKSVAKNTSLKCLSLNRKIIEDEVGEDLAKMLLYNDFIRKIELESNKLGPHTAKAFADVIRYNL
jgi:Ran GTPase-activating protein (RanGAP) involved in mRNA processing and transport